MPHTCAAEGCKNNVFSHRFCKYHSYMRRMAGGDLYKKPFKPLSSREAYNMPKESKSRQSEHKYYAEHCKELTQEIRDANNGKVFCFFTGNEIKGFITYHHLLGRTGNFYTDKSLLIPCDNDIHLFYHRATVEQLYATDWYEKGFLVRLKEKSEEAYKKEKRKLDKALLFEE